MYNLILILIGSLALVGCGKDPQVNGGSTTIVQSIPGPAALAFEGYYLLPSGGYARIDQSALGLNDITTIRLVYNNADGSQGLIPLASALSLPNVNSKLYYTANLNYVTATNNIKQDSNNAILNGSYLTEVLVYKLNDVLQIRAVVSAVNGTVLFDHTVTQQ